MFKLKYNFLAITQIILGIINYVLLLRIFGVSVQSDAYLLATSSLIVLFSLVSFSIGQFIPYYNDLKAKSVKDSHDFYNSSIFLAINIGIVSVFFINILLPLVIRFFAFNLDIERYNLFKTLLQILSFGLIFYPINQINEQLFNAEMKFSIPYILSIIPLALITATQIGMIYLKNTNIINLVIAQSIGFFVIAVLGTIYIHKNLIKYKFIKWHNLLIDEIKNSITLKLGDFGWSIAIPVLFNNFLVTFPNGYVSYFYYARKILDIANGFTVGPSARILRSKISKNISINDCLTIKKLYKSFLLIGGISFIIIIISAGILQSPILKLITNGKLNDNDLEMILIIFLTLIPWYFIIFLETPFAAITQMGKKAKETLGINMIFLVIFAPVLFIIKPLFNIYALGISTSIAQISNLILYIIVSHNILKQIENNIEENLCSNN